MKACPLVVGVFAWLILPFAVALAQTSSSQPPLPVWPPQSDLPLDDRVVHGRLANGLQYAVLRNTEPRERASLRMLVDVGSLAETDDERGLAHYLEHMGFNGTRNFPADSLVEYFQRLGMAFGADTNASTGFERTTYMIELPRGDAASLQEGFKVLRDFADGMLIDEAEVEKERGIIFAEMRARDSVEFRTMLAEFEFVLPDSRLPDRFPIGVDETLNAANRERLTAFYRRWYRPDNIALIAVGDLDPAETVKHLEAAFATMKADAPPPPEPEIGRATPVREPVAHVHAEAEASAVTVSLQVAAPYQKKPDTAANRVKTLPRSAAHAMISRRLDRLAKKENAPFNFGSASAGDFYDFASIASIELTAPPPRWREALTLAEQELRRALEHGFTAAELREITASTLNSYEEAVREAPTRRSANLANALVGAIHGQDIFTTPETELALVRPALEALTPEACLAALREAWSSSAPRIFVAGKLAPTDTVDAAFAVYRESRAQPVTAPDDLGEQAFAYTDFGPPGEVAKVERIQDLEATLVAFKNGVRLNLKRTDFRANQIMLRARLGGGRLQLPRQQPELGLIAGSLLTEGGLGKHDIDELQRVLAGRSVSVNFAVGEDAFIFSGGTSPKDLELNLQLLCAYLTDPGWRTDALAQTRRVISQSYERMQHTPAGIASLRIPRLLASGDARFGIPPLDHLLAVEAVHVARWLEPILDSAALEVAIVGDIDLEQTINLAARTLGALPPREVKPAFAEERRVSFPAPAPDEEFRVVTEIPKALVIAYWPTTDAFDVRVVRRLNLLADVFEDRLRKVIREELGAAYSPGAGSAPSDTFPGYGYLSARVEVDPDKAAAIEDTIQRIAAELHAGGVAEDELQRMKEPRLTAIRDAVRQNSYWLGSVLSDVQERPSRLEAARNMPADYAAVTKAEIDDLARRFLAPGRAAKFIIRPEDKAVAPGETAPSGPTMPAPPAPPSGPAPP